MMKPRFGHEGAPSANWADLTIPLLKSKAFADGALQGLGAVFKFLMQTGLLLGAIALSPALAGTQPPLRLCEQAAARLKADSDLADAMRAALGEPGVGHDEFCLYPLQLLRYADVDVLLTQNLAPETACHGCTADLSAAVLRRIPGGFKHVRTFDAFGKTGTFGAVSSISPIAIGGDDGLAIESGGTFQGYTSVALDLYAFRRQGLVRVDAGGPLYLEGDDGGAQTDSTKAVSIDSAWSLAANELVIDYRISDSRGLRQTRAVWAVEDTRLTLKSGAIPKEMAHAVGSE